MDSIQLMTDEHKYIKRMLKVVRKLCINIIDSKEVDYEAFDKAIDFIRNYADKHHHNKEEEVLFEKLSSDLGEKMTKGPLSGMFIEHDLGRLFISNLKYALDRVKSGDDESKVDIIGNAIGYADLLNRHIDKEDKVIYTFAKRSLSENALKEVDEKCSNIEKAAGFKGFQKNYITLLEEVERIVLK